MCRVEGRDAKQLKDDLAANGIMVRYYSSPEVLAGCIRVSVGKPEQVCFLYIYLLSVLVSFASGTCKAFKITWFVWLS
jgi:histidinol-phosphate aminotransferase